MSLNRPKIQQCLAMFVKLAKVNKGLSTGNKRDPFASAPHNVFVTKHLWQ